MGQKPEMTDEISTPEFLSRIERREREAVRLLFLCYAGILMEHLRRTRRTHGLAEHAWDDVVQETFIKLLTNGLSLDRARKIGPLLKKIALNEARDRAKSSRRRSKREAAAPVRAAAGAELASQSLHAAEQHIFVEANLAMMSDKDRQALRTYAQSAPERHVAELAKAAGIDTGAAQMRFSRAKARWAKQIKSHDHGKGGQ